MLLLYLVSWPLSCIVSVIVPGGSRTLPVGVMAYIMMFNNHSSSLSMECCLIHGRPCSRSWWWAAPVAAAAAAADPRDMLSYLHPKKFEGLTGGARGRPREKKKKKKKKNTHRLPPLHRLHFE